MTPMSRRRWGLVVLAFALSLVAAWPAIEIGRAHV